MRCFLCSRAWAISFDDGHHLFALVQTIMRSSTLRVGIESASTLAVTGMITEKLYRIVVMLTNRVRRGKQERYANE